MSDNVFDRLIQRIKSRSDFTAESVEKRRLMCGWHLFHDVGSLDAGVFLTIEFCYRCGKLIRIYHLENQIRNSDTKQVRDIVPFEALNIGYLYPLGISGEIQKIIDETVSLEKPKPLILSSDVKERADSSGS